MAEVPRLAMRRTAEANRLLIFVGLLGLLLGQPCVCSERVCFQLHQQDLHESQEWGSVDCWQLPEGGGLVLEAPTSITGPCTLDLGWNVDLLRLGPAAAWRVSSSLLLGAHVWGPGSELELAPAALSLARWEDKVPAPMQDASPEQPPVQLESCVMMVPCSVIEAYAAVANGRTPRKELQVRKLNSTTLEVMSFTSRLVSVKNTTLSCASSSSTHSSTSPSPLSGAVISAASSAERVMDVLTVAAALPGPVATHFAIPASQQLRITNASWPAAGMLLRGTTVTFEGDTAVSSVIDMHSISHFLQLREGTTLHLKHLTLINFCTRLYTLNQQLGMRVRSSSTLWPIGFTRGVLSLYVDHVTHVLPHNEIAIYIYYSCFERSAFQQLQSYFQLVRQGFVDSGGTASTLLPGVIHYRDYAGIVSRRRDTALVSAETLSSPQTLGTRNGASSASVQATESRFLSNLTLHPFSPCEPHTKEEPVSLLEVPLFNVDQDTDLTSTFFQVASAASKAFYYDTQDSSPYYLPPLALLYVNASLTAIAAVQPNFMHDVVIAGRYIEQPQASAPHATRADTCSAGGSEAVVGQGQCSEDTHSTPELQQDVSSATASVKGLYNASGLPLLGNLVERFGVDPYAPIVLDMAHLQAAMFVKPPHARLFLHNLVLDNLAVAPLPAIRDTEASQGGAGFKSGSSKGGKHTSRGTPPSSALPLWGIHYARSAHVTSVVYLDRVTLRLPASDYIAMYALICMDGDRSGALDALRDMLGSAHAATVGISPESLLRQAAALYAHTQSFSAGECDQHAAQHASMHQVSFTWGLEGVNVRLEPEADVAKQMLQHIAGVIAKHLRLAVSGAQQGSSRSPSRSSKVQSWDGSAEQEQQQEAPVSSRPYSLLRSALMHGLHETIQDAALILALVLAMLCLWTWLWRMTVQPSHAAPAPPQAWPLTNGDQPDPHAHARRGSEAGSQNGAITAEHAVSPRAAQLSRIQSNVSAGTSTSSRIQSVHSLHSSGPSGGARAVPHLHPSLSAGSNLQPHAVLHSASGSSRHGSVLYGAGGSTSSRGPNTVPAVRSLASPNTSASQASVLSLPTDLSHVPQSRHQPPQLMSALSHKQRHSQESGSHASYGAPRGELQRQATQSDGSALRTHITTLSTLDEGSRGNHSSTSLFQSAASSMLIDTFEMLNAELSSPPAIGEGLGISSPELDLDYASQGPSRADGQELQSALQHGTRGVNVHWSLLGAGHEYEAAAAASAGAQQEHAGQQQHHHQQQRCSGQQSRKQGVAPSAISQGGKASSGILMPAVASSTSHHSTERKSQHQALLSHLPGRATEEPGSRASNASQGISGFSTLAPSQHQLGRGITTASSHLQHSEGGSSSDYTHASALLALPLDTSRGQQPAHLLQLPSQQSRDGRPSGQGSNSAPNHQNKILDELFANTGQASLVRRATASSASRPSSPKDVQMRAESALLHPLHKQHLQVSTSAVSSPAPRHKQDGSAGNAVSQTSQAHVLPHIKHMRTSGEVHSGSTSRQQAVAPGSPQYPAQALPATGGSGSHARSSATNSNSVRLEHQGSSGRRDAGVARLLSASAHTTPSSPLLALQQQQQQLMLNSMTKVSTVVSAQLARDAKEEVEVLERLIATGQGLPWQQQQPLGATSLLDTFPPRRSTKAEGRQPSGGQAPVSSTELSMSTGTASEAPDGTARTPSGTTETQEGGAQAPGSPRVDTTLAAAAGGLALGPPGSDTRRMAWVPLHGGVVSAASDARRSQQLLHARAAAQQQAHHSESGRVPSSAGVTTSPQGPSSALHGTQQAGVAATTSGGGSAHTHAPPAVARSLLGHAVVTSAVRQSPASHLDVVAEELTTGQTSAPAQSGTTGVTSVKAAEPLTSDPATGDASSAAPETPEAAQPPAYELTPTSAAAGDASHTAAPPSAATPAAEPAVTETQAPGATPAAAAAPPAAGPAGETGAGGVAAAIAEAPAGVIIKQGGAPTTPSAPAAARPGSSPLFRTTSGQGSAPRFPQPLPGLHAPVALPAPPPMMPARAQGPAHAAGEGSGSSSATWDPHKEVQAITGLLGASDDKLCLIELIGQGASGRVYRGRWRNLDVAVKMVLFRECGRDGVSDGARQRAIMEAAVCKAVVHPNVVCTYSYDITPVVSARINQGGGGLQVEGLANQPVDWQLTLVQELCEATLRAALVECVLHDRETGVPNMDSILLLLVDIAAGMEYIHSRGVIHGDLKPENVLLKGEPTSPIGMAAKVTDFGLCAAIQPNQTHLSGFTNGTPYYVAPEVVAQGKVTKTSDVYSFGVLLWVMLRCLPPWVKKDNGFARNKLLGKYPPGTPEPYVALTARCMSQSPKSRPSFTQVKAELQAMHKALSQGWPGLSVPTVLPGVSVPGTIQAPPQALLPQQPVVVGNVQAPQAQALPHVHLQQQQQQGPAFVHIPGPTLVPAGPSGSFGQQVVQLQPAGVAVADPLQRSSQPQVIIPQQLQAQPQQQQLVIQQHLQAQAQAQLQHQAAVQAQLQIQHHQVAQAQAHAQAQAQAQAQMVIHQQMRARSLGQTPSLVGLGQGASMHAVHHAVMARSSGTRSRPGSGPRSGNATSPVAGGQGPVIQLGPAGMGPVLAPAMSMGRAMPHHTVMAHSTGSMGASPGGVIHAGMQHVMHVMHPQQHMQQAPGQMQPGLAPHPHGGGLTLAHVMAPGVTPGGVQYMAVQHGGPPQMMAGPGMAPAPVYVQQLPVPGSPMAVAAAGLLPMQVASPAPIHASLSSGHQFIGAGPIQVTSSHTGRLHTGSNSGRVMGTSQNGRHSNGPISGRVMQVGIGLWPPQGQVQQQQPQ